MGSLFRLGRVQFSICEFGILGEGEGDPGGIFRGLER